MLEGLQAILEKEPVLSTVNALDLQSDPSRVEGEYQRHVATFIPMGDVNEYSARLLRRISGSKTPKGMLVAPYGYGKTSTLAFLWHECESNGLVAVPPFYCANLLDILDATYGWVRYRLENRQPGLLPDLDAAYHKYTTATIEEMAKRHAEEHGVANIIATRMLENMLRAGELVLQLTPSSLLFFLDAATGLVLQAGYRGLVLFADELQQYFSKGANLRRTVQEFREFVWGLDTRSSALGMIFSVPTYAESVIQEQGKDILQRLKKDDLFYRLQDVYTVEFPLQLWRRYCDAFSLGDIAAQVIDNPTLVAIGQIAEREDLGEGPRTVIDSFKRAILYFQDHQTSYSPVDLINDFLESNIRFQAQANKLKVVTKQVLDSTVVDTHEKQNAVRLMAAFPRGCPVEVQKLYGVHDAIVALSKQSHGELMVRLAEGDTLLGLSRTGGPIHTVDRIVTRFWQGYEEDELHLESAIRGFIRRLLPRFFQQRRGTISIGWGNLDFSASPQGSYVSLVEGTFNSKYPRRRLALQVAYEASQLQPTNDMADFQFDFLLSLGGHQEEGKLDEIDSKTVRFILNTQIKVGTALPDDIRKLQEFVLPEFVTPLLMLSLVDYFDRWEEIEEETIPDADKAEIEHYSNRLTGHAAAMLFGRSVAESISPPLRRLGGQMVEELFNRLCVHLFPNYSTFFMHAQHESVITDYINAMRDMTLKQRRGHAVIQGTKDAVARRFGLNSVSTFDNRIQNEYAMLMAKTEWTGRGEQGNAEITLNLHPLEQTILEKLRNSAVRRQRDSLIVPVLAADEIAMLARVQGYRDEEILYTLQLLAARGYAFFDKQDKVIFLAQLGPAPVELKKQLHTLAQEVSNVPAGMLDSNIVGEIESRLQQIEEMIENPSADEEELDEAQTILSDINQKLSNALSERRGEFRGQIHALLLEIDGKRVVLQRSDVLEREIQGQVAFVMHLNELRQTLSRNRKRLYEKLNALRASLEQGLAKRSSGPVSDTMILYETFKRAQDSFAKLEAERQGIENQTNHLEHWIKLLRDTEQLFNALVHLSDLRSTLTREVIPEIQAHLTKTRLDALPDWEPFFEKVKAVEVELENRRRHGNEQFGEVKAKYESFLRELEVRDYRPRTRYTYGEDEGSYDDLYEEVRGKISEKLDEVTDSIERNQTDLLKAIHIHIRSDDEKALTNQIESQLTEASHLILQLHNALTKDLLRIGGDDLELLGRRIGHAVQVVESTRAELRPILFGSQELSTEEAAVLSVFDSKNDLDLTDIFVELRHRGDQISVSNLLTIIEDLYRKNRLIVRIRTRG